MRIANSNIFKIAMDYIILNYKINQTINDSSKKF